MKMVDTCSKLIEIADRNGLNYYSEDKGTFIVGYGSKDLENGKEQFSFSKQCIEDDGFFACNFMTHINMFSVEQDDFMMNASGLTCLRFNIAKDELEYDSSVIAETVFQEEHATVSLMEAAEILGWNTRQIEEGKYETVKRWIKSLKHQDIFYLYYMIIKRACKKREDEAREEEEDPLFMEDIFNLGRIIDE